MNHSIKCLLKSVWAASSQHIHTRLESNSCKLHKCLITSVAKCLGHGLIQGFCLPAFSFLFFFDGLFFHIGHAPSHKGHQCLALMLMREPGCQEQLYSSILPWLLEENIHCVEGILHGVLVKGIIRSQPEESCNPVLPTVLCK